MRLRHHGGAGMIFHNPHGLWFTLGTDQGPSEPFSYEDLVEAARHVAWHFSIGAPGSFHPPGDMLRSVMDAIARADRGNMTRLCRAYPLHTTLIDGIKADHAGTRSMILNLLKYHPSEGWTEPDPAPPAIEEP